MRRFFCRLSDERGSSLVEIMVGAALVLVVATGVFAGVERAGAVSSGSKSRAVAASIAEADQERLRAVSQGPMSGLNGTRTVTRDRVAFTVTSAARWAADRTATPNCNSTTSRSGYLRISSKVTWPDMRSSKPVEVASIVSPPNGTVTSDRGALGVKILDQDEAGIPGVGVSLSGVGLTGTTDDDGCVYWDDVPAGTYTFTASVPGLIDPNGQPSVSSYTTVTGGQTRVETAYLDDATSLSVAVRTRRYGAAEADAQVNAPHPESLHVASSKLTATNGVRSMALTGPTATFSSLFPTRYGVYVGPCALENNPANNGSNVAAVPPFSGTMTLYKPALNVHVRYGSASQNGATVKIVQKETPGGSCSRTYTATTVTFPAVSGTAGRIANPEFPYGQYAVCAQYRSGSRTRHATIGDTSSTTIATGEQVVTNNVPAGTSVNLTIPTSGSSGACP